MTRPVRVRFVVAPELDGERLDRALAAGVEGLSRRQARVLLDLGGVYLDGARVKIASRAVRTGQRVEAVLGGALERAHMAVGDAARRADEARLPPFTMLYEDDDVLVVEKPAGLLSAPTPESDRANLLALLRRGAGGRRSVHLVHRLDLQTSGVLVFARTGDANRALARDFRVHDVRREYLALVAGTPSWETRDLDAPIEGRPARTLVCVVERVGTLATIVRCRLQTGRTHQIRIHLQGIGHPVIGDPRFRARAPLPPPRLALHAALLGFRHPRTSVPLLFERPWPPDLASYVAALHAAAAC